MIATSFSRWGMEVPNRTKGAEALHEIAELGASQERVEGTAETGAAWA